MEQQKTHKYSEVLNGNINAVRSLAATIRSTVGPKGLDIMLVDEFNNYICTNDGATIMENLQISHPAAKLTAEVALSQERKVGDGTTTAVILCDSMISSALLRINTGVKPTRLARGIEIGTKKVIEELKKASRSINGVSDPKLKSIVKIAARANDEITNLVLEATKKIEKNNSKNFLEENPDAFDLSRTIVAATGLESRVLDGLFIKKRTHFNYGQSFQDAKTLVIEGAFEPEPMSSEAVSTDEGVKRFEHNIQSLLETAKKISKSGIKAIFTSSSMLASVEELFVKESIFVLTHLTKEDIQKLTTISGAKLTTRRKLLNTDQNNFDAYAGRLEKIEHVEELGGFIFKGTKAYNASILISAETQTVAEERKRVTEDAARSMNSALQTGYVMGGGLAEMNLGETVEKFRADFNDDKCVSTGIEIVVESLKALFHQITENAGFKHNDIFFKLSPGFNNTKGINLEDGELIDYDEAGIIDPAEVKISAFKIACEIATQILKINMVVQSK